MEDKFRLLFSPPEYKATLDLVRKAVKRGPRRGGLTKEAIDSLKEGLKVLEGAEPVQIGTRGEGQRGIGVGGDDGRGRVTDPETDKRLAGNRTGTELPTG